jgi:two-component system, chemotaxis family, sensor kinase CheA
MNKQDSPSQDSQAAKPPSNPDFTGGRAALTEANRQADLLYTSLAGVAAIAVVLLGGLALPVFGRPPVTSLAIFIVMVLAALIGIGELCLINYRAHRTITKQAGLTEVLLNSLGQGFLNFDAKGVCGPVYSQACLDLLECAPAGRNIVDVLRLTEEQRSDFKDWVEMLFVPNHALSFDDVIRFLPQVYSHSGGGRHIALMYRPLCGRNGQLLNVVLIATDQTEEAEAHLRARVQQVYVSMICRIFKERNQFLATITHLRKFVDESKIPVKRADSASILRLLHTLKAAAKHFFLESLADVIRMLEVELRSPSLQSEQDFQRRLRRGGEEVEACVDAVLEQIGDLIGQDYEGRGNMHEVDESLIYDFARQMRERMVEPDLIHDYLLNIAAVPINDSFHQFERELKDLAEIMGKKIKPILYTGTNPRVLTKPMEGFLLSTMHICRNIVDHGIEPAVTRLARGKDPAGLVTIHTALVDVPGKAEKMLQIVIGDDGNGIDPAAVRARLAVIDPQGTWRQDDDHAVIQRIFLWEVTTRSDVTELSGRGVGMEVVAREIKLLGGTVEVFSEVYRGTRIDIRIPYSLSVPAETQSRLLKGA